MTSMTAPNAHAQEQFIHLVRLGWDLHKRGLSTSVELPRGAAPALLVPRRSGALKIMALSHKGIWYFTWGRGQGQRVRALADEAAERIWEVAQ